MPAYAPLAERFWRHVSPEPNSGCWLWDAFCNPKGYGMIGVGKRVKLAHRVAYELLRGPIPDGMVLDHICRMKCCVNPDHLRPMTSEENSDGNRRKTRCPKGHPYDSFESWDGRRARRCRECRREQWQRGYRQGKWR